MKLNPGEGWPGPGEVIVSVVHCILQNSERPSKHPRFSNVPNGKQNGIGFQPTRDLALLYQLQLQL